MSMASEVYEMNLEETVHKQKAEITKLKATITDKDARIAQFEMTIPELKSVNMTVAFMLSEKDAEIAKLKGLLQSHHNGARQTPSYSSTPLARSTGEALKKKER